MPTSATERLISAEGTASAEQSVYSPLRVPEHSSRDRQFALLLFLASLGYLLLFRGYTTMEPDEGIVLQGAQRILHGQVLYRDFFSYFTPGSYYCLALLFKIFGSSFMVARSALAVTGAAFSLISYLLMRRICSIGVSFFIAALVTLTTLPFRFLALHNWDSTLWACLAVYCAVRMLESRRPVWAMGVGTLVSLCFLSEQSKGAGLGLGLAIGLFVIGLKDRRLRSRALMVAVAIGLTWPLVLTLFYFAAQHSLPLMISDWLWPLRHYSVANHVPYGYQDWSDSTREELFHNGPWMIRLLTALALSPAFLIPALPLLAIGIGAYWAFRLWQNSTPDPRCRYYVLTCAAIAGLLLSIVIGRADIVHFIYLLPLFCLPLAWLFDGRDVRGELFQRFRPLLSAYIAIAFLLFAAPLLLRDLSARSRLATRRGEVRTPAQDTVIDYVQAHVRLGGALVVYPYLPLYYYLTATFNPTQYEYFQPGMNTLEQANEIIAELRLSRNSAVLFEPSFVEKIPRSWPGTPIKDIVTDPVADFLVHEYQTCKILSSPSNWKFLFMVRKGLACP
jgi:4-amino-4-deoxy-L-arabinose transferase-like glycosyltransferase